MRRVYWITGLVVAAALLALAQESKKADESMIVAFETAWNQAELHHDSKAVESLIADTFIYVDIDGSIQTKAQYMAGIKDASYHPEQIVNEDPKVFMYGATAIVTSTYRTRGTSGGKAFEHHGRFVDVWLNRSGKWQCVSSQSTLLK